MRVVDPSPCIPMMSRDRRLRLLVDGPIDRSKRALITAGLVALLPAVCRADVVPPKAVEAADGWLALVDRGRYREAVARYFDASAPADARALVVRLDHARALRSRKVARRSMTAWLGHGEGDTSRMAPGSYFSMLFDVVDGSGTVTTDEVRLVPRGDAWRVVGYEWR